MPGTLSVGFEMTVYRWSCLMLAGLSLALSGCGGVGGSASTPAAPSNAAPIADAGSNITTGEASRITLDGSNSRDNDGSIAQYSWAQISGPLATLAGGASAQLNVQTPLVRTQTTLSFQLRVTDNDGASSTDRVDVIIEPAIAPSRLEDVFRHDGILRTATVYTPASYVPGNPVVLLLHGGGGNMWQVINGTSTPSRWLDLADRDGMLLISANGYNIDDGDGLGTQQRWNDLRTDPSGVLTTVDDVGFLLQVLARADAGRDTAGAKTYVTGSSNGGMMSMRLLIEAGASFDGAVSFIGALPEEAVANASDFTPIMLVNGDLDPLILWAGGEVSNGNRGRTRSVSDTLDYWLQQGALDRRAGVETTLADADPSDNCRLIRTDFGAAPSPIVFIEMRGGGHTIPNPFPPVRSPALEATVGNQCTDAHGIDLAWDFLRAH